MTARANFVSLPFSRRCCLKRLRSGLYRLAASVHLLPVIQIQFMSSGIPLQAALRSKRPFAPAGIIAASAVRR
jgi:hypothetical protein